MIKKIICGLILILCVSGPLFAQNDKRAKLKFRTWDELLVGSGGTVGSLWSWGHGYEYEFFRDDYNHELGISLETFNDRTSYTGQKLLMPVLVNYRWYSGSKPFQGFYLTGGLGEAIPFGRDHGSGSIAWTGGVGVTVFDKMALEIRYLGRSRQQVTNGISTLTTNNSFILGSGSYLF